MSTQAAPQLSIRAIALSIVLAIILAAANTYLGLFAGLTIASAIPAAVVSMAVLRVFGGGYQAIVGNFVVSIPMTVIMVVAGFLFCSVSAYMAGLVGSSNNPVSGITISTILFASLVLMLLMGRAARRWARSRRS
jgi:uncharacterized oligopeptide transporter (OPT) family protein